MQNKFSKKEIDAQKSFYLRNRVSDESQHGQ